MDLQSNKEVTVLMFVPKVFSTSANLQRNLRQRRVFNRSFDKNLRYGWRNACDVARGCISEPPFFSRS
jgi:hypothetical protein